MAGRKLPDIPESRGRGHRRPIGKNLAQHARFDLRPETATRQDRFDFGAEYNAAVSGRIKQGADTEAISRKKKAVFTAIPDCKRELTIEPIHAARTPLLIRMQQDLRVRATDEAMAQGLQFRTEFHVVENLTVKHHPFGSIFVAKWLLPGFQINDAQPGASEAQRLFQINPEFIRPAMPNNREHLPQLLLADLILRLPMKNASDAAHQFFQLQTEAARTVATSFPSCERWVPAAASIASAGQQYQSDFVIFARAGEVPRAGSRHFSVLIQYPGK